MRYVLNPANTLRLLKLVGPVVDRDMLTWEDAFPGALIYIGTRCAHDDDPLSSGEYAHAHADPRNESYGLICIRPRCYTGRPYGSPPPHTPTGRARRKAGHVETLWHEYAHLVVGAGHTKAWRDLMRSYGFGESAEEYRSRYAASRRLPR